MRRVTPKVYTKKYYLTDCTGYNEYKKSLGEEFEPRFKEIIKYFAIKPNTRVLDVGCGRGEMVLFAAKMRAEGFGIDYSKNAIALANSLKKGKPFVLQQKMHFLAMDAKCIKFADSYFDTVILTDVIEHLYSEELEIVFKEIKRVLKNEGQLIIHTAPNRLFNDYGYRYYSYPISTLIVSIWNIFNKNKYPNIEKSGKLRTDSHSIMHVNEPTYFSLQRLIKQYGFKGSIFSSNITVKKPIISFKDSLFNFLVFFHPISRKFPLNVFFGSDFICILENIK